MKRYICASSMLSALLITIISTSSIAYAATFPINQTFSGAQPSDWELRGSAAWNATVASDQTLLLTPSATSQAGLGFYNDSFPSTLGFVAEFRYYSGGGTGADGLAFFLVDGDLVDESNIAAGALGGALGYAQSTLTPSNGIPHAYLGVGFDEFGNFVTDSGGMDPGSGIAIPDSVVLRGSGNGLTGYDYLTHRDVFDDFGERIDGGWRIARVTVVPETTTATVRVEMSWDEGDTWETIIDDYVYNEVPPENLKLGFTAGTGGSTNIHAIGNLTVNLPVDLRTTLVTAPAGVYERGDSITYRYTVVNNGPNDSSNTLIENTIPIGSTGIENLTWSLTSTHGSSSAGTGANFDEIAISIPAGETVTVTATGTIGAAIINTTDLNHTITATPEAAAKDPSPGDARVNVSITTDAPTASESALLKILAYVESGGTTTAPTVDDFDDAGITDVGSRNIATVNEVLAQSSVTTGPEVQAVVNAIAIVVDYATSAGASNAPTTLDYARTNIEGVTADNLARVNTAVAGSGLTTLAEIRQFVADFLRQRGGGGATRISSGGQKTEASNGVGTQDTVSSLRAKIAQLQKTLRALSFGGGSSTTTVPSVPVRDLTGGMTGEDVRALQVLLIAQDYEIPAGPTGYFGSQTKTALARYQADNAIVPAQGYFGSKTRANMKMTNLPGLWW